MRQKLETFHEGVRDCAVHPFQPGRCPTRNSARLPESCRKCRKGLWYIRIGVFCEEYPCWHVSENS
ncbi:hypothetical protein FJZ31_10500 [Candidatus Poribacteria bacterium]|nr:hypothetical protein [Candidatus Poribacteria bacterium]